MRSVLRHAAALLLISGFLPAQAADDKMLFVEYRVVSADLQRSGLFRPLDPNSFLERNLDVAVEPHFDDWRTIGAQGLINGEAKKEDPPIVLKPKDEGVVMAEQANDPPLVMKPKQEVKSASQIVNEQRGK